MSSLEIALVSMARRGKIVEAIIKKERPDLIDLFLTYQNEVTAAREFLEPNLAELDSGTKILEIGGGILGLAIQLASEGFEVTTVEPVGKGFSGVSFIMEVYLEIARHENLSFNFIKSPIEECEFNHEFDFIFSINVMEHLENPFSVLLQMTHALKPSGSYRFFCPNYDFPYEPHFSKWLWLRRNSSFYLESSRAKGLKLGTLEQKDLFESLNFITLRSITRFCQSNQIRFSCSSYAFYNLLDRVTKDRELANRHGRLGLIVIFMHRLKFHALAKAVPRKVQPVMDVTVQSLS
jgi:SAM-dependent methyltransferase